MPRVERREFGGGPDVCGHPLVAKGPIGECLSTWQKSHAVVVCAVPHDAVLELLPLVVSPKTCGLQFKLLDPDGRLHREPIRIGRHVPSRRAQVPLGESMPIVQHPVVGIGSGRHGRGDIGSCIVQDKRMRRPVHGRGERNGGQVAAVFCKPTLLANLYHTILVALVRDAGLTAQP